MKISKLQGSSIAGQLVSFVLLAKLILILKVGSNT